jgi:hypothetical protein
MKLTPDEFFHLKTELEITPLMTDEELYFIKSAHPQLYYSTIGKHDQGVSLITENTFIFSLKNETLNKFICEKFDEPLENLYMIHRLIYGVGGHGKRHKDRFTTHKTVSIILSDKFEGGEMFINDKQIELNKKGDYVCFNGGTDWHEIKEIKKGHRDVLIVWFSKKQSKFSLI